MPVIEIAATLEVTTPTFSAGIPPAGTGAGLAGAVTVTAVDGVADVAAAVAAGAASVYIGGAKPATVVLPPASSTEGVPFALWSATDLSFGVSWQAGEVADVVTLVGTVDLGGTFGWWMTPVELGGVHWTGHPVAPGGGGADLSDTTPSALGTAAAGTGTAASRDDHVHAMPTASDVGADPAGTAAGLVDDLSGVTDAATARSNLGLGTAATTAATDYATAAHNHSGVYQPADADLTAIAGLTSAADKLPYFTGAGTAALADLSSFGRSLIADADAATARTTLGISADGDTTRRILIPTNQFDRASAGISWSADVGSSIGWGFLQAATGLVNDYVEWDVWMPAGTWTLLYYYLTGATYGIATVSLDGTTLGATIDGYSASSVRNNVATRSGIVVATAGVKVLKVLMASKNASSSAYKAGTQLFDFRRTA